MEGELKQRGGARGGRTSGRLLPIEVGRRSATGSRCPHHQVSFRYEAVCRFRVLCKLGTVDRRTVHADEQFLKGLPKKKRWKEMTKEVDTIFNSILRANGLGSYATTEEVETEVRQTPEAEAVTEAHARLTAAAAQRLLPDVTVSYCARDEEGCTMGVSQLDPSIESPVRHLVDVAALPSPDSEKQVDLKDILPLTSSAVTDPPKEDEVETDQGTVDLGTAGEHSLVSSTIRGKGVKDGSLTLPSRPGQETKSESETTLGALAKLAVDRLQASASKSEGSVA